MELRDIFTALRGSWWVPLVGLLVGAAAALGFSIIATPAYTATTQLFVSTTESASTADVFAGNQFSQQRVASYAQLLTGKELAGRVVKALDLDIRPGTLARDITATAVPDTVLIDVSVTQSTAQRAQAIAQRVGTEFSTMVAALETPTGATVSPVKVTVVDPPGLPSSPSEPKTLLNMALGALAGLLLGTAITVGRAALDRTVKDSDEAAQLAGGPVIGVILRDASLDRTHLVDRAGQSRTAEDFRQLRTNLQFIDVDNPPRVVMITSAVPSEGKTTAVVNLAVALADAGMTVTIVEADLRRPKVTRYLGMVSGVGLTNVLTGAADLDEVLQRHGDGGPSVLGSGPTPPNPGELLASSQMVDLLEKLRSHNDVVLVDVPPLLPVADASGLAAHVDGAILSVRYGSTRKDQLQQAGETFRRAGGRTLGVILNIVPPKADLALARGYGYDYGYSGGKHAEG